jgi:hypothetical protein
MPRRHTLLDVLDLDDGVVDQDADDQGQRQQGHHVQREAQPCFMTKKVGISETGMAKDGDHAVARQSRRKSQHHQGRQEHALQQHVLGGAEVGAGLVHGGIDAGEVDPGVGLLQARPAWPSPRPRRVDVGRLLGLGDLEAHHRRGRSGVRSRAASAEPSPISATSVRRT